MTQSNYDAWVYFQENPTEEPLHQHGAPRMTGGLGNSFAAQWDEQERQKNEAEVTRREDEYLKSKGINFSQ